MPLADSQRKLGVGIGVDESTNPLGGRQLPLAIRPFGDACGERIRLRERPRKRAERRDHTPGGVVLVSVGCARFGEQQSVGRRQPVEPSVVPQDFGSTRALR